MVSKCANPDCAVSFRYFHLGKLFRLETSAGLDRRRTMSDDGRSGNKPLRRLEFYWLCEDCAQKMTLVFEKDAGITVQPTVYTQSAAA